MITVESFHDPRYSRSRYRLRWSDRQTWLKDGYTQGSYRLRRDAQSHANGLNRAGYGSKDFGGCARVRGQ